MKIQQLLYRSRNMQEVKRRTKLLVTGLRLSFKEEKDAMGEVH